MKRPEIIIVSWGGIGDALVCTPALRAIKENNPQCDIILYAINKRHMEVFKNNPNLHSLRLLRSWAMWRYPKHLYAYLFNQKSVKFTYLDFQFISPTFIYDKSIKRIVADIFGIQLDNDQVGIYLTEKENNDALERMRHLKNVVFLHVYSRSSKNHHWDLKNWVSLVGQLPEYTFIQLGNVDEPYINGALDWRSKTSIREAFALIRNGKSFVGIDSSFAHVTNAFNIPGVVLFGDSTPVIWGHDNNINIYKNLSCSPCYYYLLNNSCPYNHECMSEISVLEVKHALQLQMIKASLKVD